MVIYDLICSLGHKFEGWFPGHQAFEDQLKKNLLQCQICGDTHVTKLLSGGHFIQSSVARVKEAPSIKEDPKLETKKETLSVESLAATSPIDTVTFLKTLKHYVTSHFENVGNRFAQTLREMHRGEISPKNIYGVVSPEEQEKLIEEEVPHFVLPEIPPEFEN